MTSSGTSQPLQQAFGTARPLPLPGQSSELRVLVVDAKASSRQDAEAVKTTSEALQLLATHGSPGNLPFDLILKDHQPPHSDACRLLRKLSQSEHFRVPVVVMSTQDERDMVATCLSMGATDYLVKPLRHNELRNIWTRIWWWQRQSAAQVYGMGPYAAAQGGFAYPPYSVHDDMQDQASSASEETKDEDEEEPVSKEGSAPDGVANGSNGNGSNENGSKGNGGSNNGHGSAGGHGSNGNGSNGNGGSNNANGESRVDAKADCVAAKNGSSDEKNGHGSNGNSDCKHGDHNGNSATKHASHRHGSGNRESTTLILERLGSAALLGTAQGKVKVEGAGEHHHHQHHAHQHHHSLQPQQQLASRHHHADAAGKAAAAAGAAVEGPGQQQQQQQQLQMQMQQPATVAAAQQTFGPPGTSQGPARSAFAQYTGPPSSSRKRSASEMLTSTRAGTPQRDLLIAGNGSGSGVGGGGSNNSGGRGGSGQLAGSGGEQGSVPVVEGGLRGAGPWERYQAPPSLLGPGNTGPGAAAGSHLNPGPSMLRPNPMAHPGYPNPQPYMDSFLAAQMLQQPGLQSALALAYSAASGHASNAAMESLMPQYRYHMSGDQARAVEQAAAAAAQAMVQRNRQASAQQQQAATNAAKSVVAAMGADGTSNAGGSGSVGATLLQQQGSMGQQGSPMHGPSAGMASNQQQLNAMMLGSLLYHHSLPPAPWRPQHPGGFAAPHSGYLPNLPPHLSGALPSGSLASGGTHTGTNGNGATIGGGHNGNGGRNAGQSQLGAVGGEQASNALTAGGSVGMLDSAGRRKTALEKYRKKRKNLRFSKAIRYESRKQLAQQRPRIKGQFVKQDPLKSGSGGANGSNGADGSNGLDGSNGADGSNGGDGSNGNAADAAGLDANAASNATSLADATGGDVADVGVGVEGSNGGCLGSGLAAVAPVSGLAQGAEGYTERYWHTTAEGAGEGAGEQNQNYPEGAQGAFEDEEYDNDEDDEMDEDEEEDCMDEDGKKVEDEADVVNSLWAAGPAIEAGGVVAGVHVPEAGSPCAVQGQSSGRVHSGHGSRGQAHSRLLGHPFKHQRTSQQTGDPNQPNQPLSLDVTGRGAVGSNDEDNAGNNSGSNGKNGSDSGSNSPDENGGAARAADKRNAQAFDL